MTHSLQRLYAAYTEARRGETLVAAQMADRDEGTRFEANPIERVRDLIEANRNYFPELEQAAENMRDELNVPRRDCSPRFRRGCAKSIRSSPASCRST